MFLKSLTLKGFKSFADTTALDFEPGVTVVVGPNGSGKSNVVDAVAWVLGAQGPRTLRSAKMEDVIFAGTPSRPALGRAEVALTIDNSAGLLPIEFSEVTITRTLFRTGESEYAINRVPCRLLDIQDLLSDTGVGRQQHVIVSQGNLDAVLSSRPEDRRLVIEEAAGILKFRRRKEKAERRLESTEGSLLRLQDLLREVRRQLRPLEKQAEAARRHGEVSAELHALRRHLAGRELATIESRMAAAMSTKGGLAATEEALRTSLARLDAEIASSEVELDVSRRRESEQQLTEAVSRSEALRERARGLLALVTERRRANQRELTTVADQGLVAALEAEATGLERQLRDVEMEGYALDPERSRLADAESALEAESASVEERWSGSAPPRTDAATEVRCELVAHQGSFERLTAERGRAETQVAASRDRLSRLEDEALALRKATTEYGDAAAALEAEVVAAHERLASSAATAREAAERRSEADAEHHRWSARGEALAQALDEARARTGVRRLAGVPGVVGSLLELVDVEEEWQPAFEAAAGDALAAVVVDGVDAGRLSLEELDRLGASGSVVPLPGADAFATGALDPQDPGREDLPAGAEALRRVVRGRLPAVDRLLDRLLARAVVVRGGWAEALDLALSHPLLTVVTAGGDRCSGGIWRVGSGGTGATGAALDEARRRAGESDAARRRAIAAASAADEEVDAARAVAADAERRRDANAGSWRAASDSVRRCDRELADARNALEASARVLDELCSRLSREQVRVAELQEVLPALEEAAAEATELALAERADRSRLAERAATVAAMRRDLEVRIASMDERRSLVAARLEEVEGRLQHVSSERDEAAARRSRLELAEGVLEGITRVLGETDEQLDRLAIDLRDARRREAEAVSTLVEKLEAIRRQRTTAERQLAETRERHGRAEIEETEARVRLEGLSETVRRELECEPEATRDAPCPELPPGTSASARRSELERELRLMGPVNPLALEEYTALSERHSFLDAQLEDVRAARRDLSKVIRAIDSEIGEVFGAAFADVAENFENLFATLFPGGQGRLRLTDPEHPLDTGIEIEARPSGKNVRRLSLLSGGERSLAALAFLFAVFRARPSPFYLMDEVEAALDDVNLHRFLDLVHEFRDEAQLLIVSHQKRTMEAADCLYGVTMAPGGSSRVVSERVTAGA